MSAALIMRGMSLVTWVLYLLSGWDTVFAMCAIYLWVIAADLSRVKKAV